jgi:phage tail-like protein
MIPRTTENPNPPAVGEDMWPLRELAFNVLRNGEMLGKFAECSGLAAEYEVTDYNEGGNNDYVHRLRGRVRYPNVTLKRGVTTEDALLKWFYEVKASAERPPVIIQLTDMVGAPLREFSLTSAMPIRWTGPSIAASSTNPATESLEIVHLGFG